MIESKKRGAKRAHEVGIIAHVQVCAKAILQRFDHSNIASDPTGEGDLLLDADSPEESDGARGDRLMDALQNVFYLLTLPQPLEHFRFGEYRAGSTDADWPFGAKSCGAQLIQGNVEGTGSRP